MSTNQQTAASMDTVPDGWAPPSIDFVPASLPALPTIADPVLALQARTLKASLMRVAGARDNRSAELDSNELLEWSGDAILHALVSKRLRAVFPRGTAAELSVRTTSRERCRRGCLDPLKSRFLSSTHV